MKTIEQKSKAYDEALERAKKELQACGSTDCDAARQIFRLFPEFKESEDERIRKEIIETFKNLGDGKIPIDIHYADIFTWLEKQGKKETIYDKCRKEHPSHSCRDITALGRCAVEHEPADKPKFHKGEWVISTLPGIKYPHLITDIQDGYYIFGEDDDHVHIASNDNILKLWTIDDAKDGDVLCVKYGNDEMPFIFTGKQDNVAYCALNSFGEFVLSIAEWLLKISVLPATKEQHDTLFAKMKESGYEWNAEKKELKKIPQRMVSAEAKEALYDKPAWSEEDENMLKMVIKSCEQCGNEYAYYWLNSLKQRMGGEV